MDEQAHIPERCSQAEYARLRGLSRAYVSQLRDKNRLVLDERGLVMVKNTDILVDATRHPTRGGDRTGKHARQAEACSSTKVAASSAGATPANSRDGNAAMTLAEAARGEKLERMRKLRLENAENAKQLVRRDVVDSETFKRARQAQEALMSLKERLSPLLALESDERAIDALLDAEFRHVIAAIAGTESSETQP